MASWQKEISSDIVGKILGFLISPFLGGVISIRRINTKSSFIIFFLFAVIFGLSFETSIGKDETHRGDAAQYRYKFEYYSEISKGDMSDIITAYSTFEDGETRDIYVPFMSFVTSRISRNYHIFFALLACVFSLIMLKSLKFFTNELPERKNLSVLILLYLFALSNSIFNINGCRFWTAAWLAVYSMFQIFLNGNRRYYLLAAITPMIHASYWFFLGILTITFFLRNNLRLWKILFFLSFILSSISMELIVDASDYLPPALQFLVERYTESEHEVKNNLYQVLSRMFDFAGMAVRVYMVYLLMSHEKIVMNNPKTQRLYPLILVFMSICQFVMPIPSLGKRYIVLSLPLLAYVWYITFEKQAKYRNVLVLYMCTSIMDVYELLMDYLMYSVPISFYYTSPVYLIFNNIL